MGKATGTTTATSTTGLPVFQTPYVTRQLEEAARLFSSPGPGFFPGSLTARFTPLEAQGQQAAVSAAQGSLPQIASQAQNAFNFGTSDVLRPDTNPYAQATGQAIIRPLYQNLTENILPAIRSNAVATGNLGSSRTGIAEGLAAGRTSQSAADALSQFFTNAYGQGLNVFSNTLAQAPTVQSLQLAPAQTLAGVGAQERTLNQADINEQVQRYGYEQALPYTKLAEYANLIRGPFGGTSTSTLEAPPPSTTSQVLGGSLGILALINQLRGLFGG